MPEVHENWTGDEWEYFVYGLLQDRHGAINVAKVPSTHGGDQGVDYLCKCACTVYQCYAAQEPITTSDRANSQKDKIREDIRKFTDNHVALGKLFGATKMKRWILVVPIHSSSSVNHYAAKKTEEVKKLNRDYIDDDFEILIHDKSSFDSASYGRRMAQRQIISLSVTDPTSDEIDNWLAESENRLIDNLKTKLSKRAGLDTSFDINEEARDFVGYLLHRDNILESLRNSSPQVYEQVKKLISTKDKQLRFTRSPADGVANSILASQLETLKAVMQTSVSLSEETAQDISFGTISDWLMRCPLNFPPYD